MMNNIKIGTFNHHSEYGSILKIFIETNIFT
jgi:hypothetical protein